MNFIDLEVLWVDDDGMFQLAVKAASSTHAVYHETYVYPESLAIFGEELGSFPRGADAVVVLECGSKDPTWHDYLHMRVFLLKAIGQSALELKSEVRGAPPVRSESHFYIQGMPADFNRMGRQLVAWLAEPSEPFRMEWQNG